MIFLYKLGRNKKFTLEEDTQVFILETIDRMYSRCFDSSGNLYHFSASTKVNPLNEEHNEAI